MYHGFRKIIKQHNLFLFIIDESKCLSGHQIILYGFDWSNGFILYYIILKTEN